MARPWRIVFKEALYHVFSRGNEGRGIVADDGDRKYSMKPSVMSLSVSMWI
jgi:hypothetical protein